MALLALAVWTAAMPLVAMETASGVAGGDTVLRHWQPSATRVGTAGAAQMRETMVRVPAAVLKGPAAGRLLPAVSSGRLVVPDPALHLRPVLRV
jgi:hypothetical protein